MESDIRKYRELKKEHEWLKSKDQLLEANASLDASAEKIDNVLGRMKKETDANIVELRKLMDFYHKREELLKEIQSLGFFSYYKLRNRY